MGAGVGDVDGNFALLEITAAAGMVLFTRFRDVDRIAVGVLGLGFGLRLGLSGSFCGGGFLAGLLLSRGLGGFLCGLALGLDAGCLLLGRLLFRLRLGSCLLGGFAIGLGLGGGFLGRLAICLDLRQRFLFGSLGLLSRLRRLIGLLNRTCVGQRRFARRPGAADQSPEAQCSRQNTGQDTELHRHFTHELNHPSSSFDWVIKILPYSLGYGYYHLRLAHGAGAVALGDGVLLLDRDLALA
ncbi:hypothetical protein FM068_02450 [Adlercreutzia equolifaciens]|uniref:Uncharacterized protein n=1 Tax=Adlercreutzia equolifaciens TaxID=446660 RepID=A0A6L8Q2G0_9ACTN|nr:hypothetical protein [Adlercreutzia equolifaciens]